MPRKAAPAGPSAKAGKAAKPAPPSRPSRAGGSAASAKVAGPEKRRLWLTYPPKLITRPIIWEMTRKFDVIFNVRQASVTDELGILCLELEAPRESLKSAITWLERQGVRVEPVEINVIES